MSFRDFGPQPKARPPPRGYPKVVPTMEQQTQRQRSRSTGLGGHYNKKNVMVLHGRVIELDDRSSSSSNTPPDMMSSGSSSSERSPVSVREQLSRKSTFQKLHSAVVHYQKLVSDLESVLKQAGDTPEAAWRARILMKSAQETDKVLHQDLYKYEQSLCSKNQDTRRAQTAVMKLHRDYKRSHRALGMCLQLYHTQQRVDMSTLGAVGWTEGEPHLEHDPVAVQHLHASMQSVQQLYTDLAGMVQQQQEPLDQLEKNLAYANQNVTSGHRSIGQRFMCDQSSCLLDTTMSTGYDPNISLENDDSLPDHTLQCGDWFGTSLETLKDDLWGISNDILESVPKRVAK